MAVVRTDKTKNYTVLSNYHLRDKEISLKAKGLLSVVLSLPDEWDYSTDGIIAMCLEGRDAIATIIKELKEHGYVSITEERNDKGRFEYVWTFYETPIGHSPTTDLPYTDTPTTETPTQLNTNKLNTKELNINNIKNTQKEQNFEAFWSAYPKKVGKKKCQEWFDKHKLTEELMELIINALNKQKNSIQWTKDNGQFIPG